MSLIVNRAGAPSIHVLIIGVGDYPFLVGGSRRPMFAKHGGMGQLTSAPVSTRALARWLLDDFAQPDYHGCSVELLLSDASGQNFTDGQGVWHAIERATFANIERAVQDWFARADAT